MLDANTPSFREQYPNGAIVRDRLGRILLGVLACNPETGEVVKGKAGNGAAAQGEVDELVAALEADAECVAAERPDLMQLTDKQLTRIAELLKCIPHA